MSGKREKTERQALNAALARLGDRVLPVREQIGREVRRSRHFGAKKKASQ
jgi:hypothetical protein